MKDYNEVHKCRKQKCNSRQGRDASSPNYYKWKPVDYKGT